MLTLSKILSLPRRHSNFLSFYFPGLVCLSLCVPRTPARPTMNDIMYECVDCGEGGRRGGGHHRIRRAQCNPTESEERSLSGVKPFCWCIWGGETKNLLCQNWKFRSQNPGGTTPKFFCCCCCAGKMVIFDFCCCCCAVLRFWGFCCYCVLLLCWIDHLLYHPDQEWHHLNDDLLGSKS